MNVHRLIGAVLLLIAASTLWANPLTSRKITNARFLGWVNLQDVCTDNAIDQMWRQRLYEIPRGLDGYTIVSYKAGRTDSSAKAADAVKELNHQRRFNEYTAKGYKVIATPWTVRGFQAVKFTVQGIDLTGDENTAHRADIYTFAVAAENWFIWLEVRQVINGPEMTQLDRAMVKAGGQQMAEDLVDQVYSLWNPGVDVPPAQVTPPDTTEPPKPNETTPPANPPTPEDTQPAATPPKPVETPPAANPPKPEDTPPAANPPKPEDTQPAANPPKPVDTPPAANPPKPEDTPPAATQPKPVETPPAATQPKPVETPPAANPPKPEDTPPAVNPPKPVETPPAANPPKPEVAPELPAGTRAWSTPDGAMTLVLPAAWTVNGKSVFTITGPTAINARVLPPESYRSADELTRALKDFADTQQDISERKFTSKPFNPDGATGVQVHYTAVQGHTMHMYYFGKSGRLWRLEIEMDGDGTLLTAELAQMVNMLTVR